MARLSAILDRLNPARVIRRRQGVRPDICFILEGTYPYVAGGVSSWVHQLISQMPELRFGIVHLSPSANFYAKLAYELPENVVLLEELPLRRARHSGVRLGRSVPREAVREFWRFAAGVRRGNSGGFADFVRRIQQLPGDAIPAAGEFLNTRESWNVLVSTYRREASNESFLNFFWTWHFAYQPLLNVLAYPLPVASAYHTVSTGYAGVCAAAAKLAHGRDVILTEHGIYTKERRIEIHSADWIPQSSTSGSVFVENSPPYFKQFWNQHFQVMSKICYEHADEIFTLYHGNAHAQVSDGADPGRIRVIPNGIDLLRMNDAAERLAQRAQNERFTVGFVGRVCPIKDVRTLIAATRLVARKVPDVLVRIMGPTEEDPDYAADCRRLTAEFGLQDNVRFEGRVNVAEHLPDLDVLVLTSISEAQPLAVLEAGAVGLPVVTTDVGCCRDLLFGKNPEDKSLGVGGITTAISSPGETAAALLRLHGDPDLRAQMGRNLQQRVRRFYAQQDMITAYSDIYQRHLNAGEPV